MLGPSPIFPESRQEWYRWAAGALWAAAGLVLVVLCWRRAAGAFSRDMAEPLACLAATCLGLIGLAATACYRLGQGQLSEGRAVTALALGGVAAPALVAAVLAPGVSAPAIAFVTVVAVGSGALQRFVLHFDPARWTELLQPAGTPGVTPPAAEPPVPMVSAPASFADCGECGGPDLVQWSKRRRTQAEGATWDVLEGMVVVTFEPGQRRTAVHVPIMPAMPAPPEVEWELFTESDRPHGVPADVQVEVNTVKPFGLRIDVRRPAPDETALTVRIGYTCACEITPASTAA
jgi:hypothetical protein